MAIVGFDFTKIDAQKNGPMKGNVNINNNVTIKDVKTHDLNLGTEKRDAVRFIFEFSAKYEPNVGHINLEGNVVYMDDSKKIKELMDGWKKDKKLPKEVSKVVLNTVLNKSNIKALIMSQDIGLPAPIPIPKVDMDNPTAVKKK